MLGPLRVRAGGTLLGPTDFGGRKPKQVLEILLVHQGQPVAKERIADLLWGEGLPSDPMRTLEAYVSGLRRRLHPDLGEARRLVRSEPRAYRFAVDDAHLDVSEFDRVVQRAAAEPVPVRRLELRRRALALVGGELLADEPYAEWAFPLRNLYAERHLQLLLDAAEDCLTESSPEEAVGYANSVIAAQPTRERAYRLLLLAYYALGEQDLAVRTYERCRHVLDEELGVQPLRETDDAYVRVLEQRPVADVLPTPPVARVTARPPPVRFARSGEATIAYQTLGDGPVDVVFAHAWFSHMEVGWEEPRYADFLHRLAQGRRLIVFDRRGMGMSDPAPPTVTLPERAADIRAVMDAAGSRRAVLFGSCGSGPHTVALAAASPERVAGLVLFGTFARMLACPGYPAGWTDAFFEQYKAALQQAWGTGRGVVRSVPTAGRDLALMEWLARLLRLSVSAASARAILDFGRTLDVRELLPRVTTPTLVLHRRDDQWIAADNGRYLADHIQGARFVELDGADHWPWFGDSASVLDPVETFLGTLA